MQLRTLLMLASAASLAVVSGAMAAPKPVHGGGHGPSYVADGAPQAKGQLKNKGKGKTKTNTHSNKGGAEKGLNRADSAAGVHGQAGRDRAESRQAAQPHRK